MPLTRLQKELLNVIARNRDPESFLAGGVPINRSGPRYSSDIDVFHDAMERVGSAAMKDVGALMAEGFAVEWERQLPALMSAVVSRGGESTKIEWAADSDFRYFPAVRDEEFGFVLHYADLAVNKLMAAVGRREPRDVVDLLTLTDCYLPLGAIAWAAAEVAPGFTPEGLLAELRRNASKYTAADYRQLAMSSPVDAADIARRLRTAILDAEQFVSAMPSDRVGRLFIKDGAPTQPDPRQLDAYVEHQPLRRGHWPSSPDITAAMLERLQAGGRA